MPEISLKKNSLILYKNQPGTVTQLGKKIEITLADGRSLSVRPKDVTVLHPGPLGSLSELTTPAGDLATACELLAGETTTLPELAELAYHRYSPASAWTVWQLLEDGLLLSGTPEAITVHLPEEVAQIETDRAQKAAAEQAWAGFLARLTNGRYAPEDAGHLQEVVALALGQRDNSKILRALGQSENREQAHALLLNIGFWDETINPYPERLGINTEQPAIHLSDLPDEERRDLTHLSSWAIDDEDNQDPDDAISLDGEILWVHIADVAALVPPHSAADEEARGRAANLYLPEGTIPMLPPTATNLLGLGLTDISPALSFALQLNDQDDVTLTEVVPSWVRVTRLTYAEAESGLDDSPLAELYAFTSRFEARRLQNGSVNINLPEVKVRVDEGVVEIRPLPPLRSRDLVRDAMLMTGEAVAKFARDNNIPLPFTVQDPPDTEDRNPERPSEMLALRKMLKRSQQVTTPGLHAGLGLNLYAQATSPLRRYLDLVVHQQLRAYLRGAPLLDEQEILTRIGTADAIIGAIRTAERLSNTHWKLVYLLQNPEWAGEGIILDQRGNRSTVVLPDLELETDLYLKGDPPLDSIVSVVNTAVDIPALTAHFRS